uniref:Uncharacterized protein n=1 Tax=Physcomitrium patens TaxID=3218 RepID=A0A7I4CXS3_PHYPA
MASTPGFLHPLPSPPLLCLPSSSSSCSSSSCISPRLNRCSVAYLVSRELRTNCGFRRVEVLRAAESEITAPAPAEEEGDMNLPCNTCNGKGFLLCDFCKGQKTNVQVRANKFYRRCPSCRAVSSS